VIDKFVRDVIISCGDDVITMNMVEDHVIIRIVDPCSSLENVSSHVTHAFTADFSTASVSQLQFYRPLIISRKLWDFLNQELLDQEPISYR